MPDELAARFIVTIGAREFHSAPEPGSPYQPIEVEIEHRDNEASRLLLKVWDAVTDVPFPQFNQTPNPRCNPDIPVLCWMGWEDGPLVPAFAGQLQGCRAHYQLSQTWFSAIHNAIKLRKRAKAKSYPGLTLLELLQKLAGEEGLTIKLDSTAANDPALHTPASMYFQIAEPNWALMLRYIHGMGYVTNTVNTTEINLKWDKSAGSTITLERGDKELISFDCREEQRRDTRSPRGRGHSGETKHGQFIHHDDGTDCGGGRRMELQSKHAKKKNQQKQVFPERFSIKGASRRLEREGDELTLAFRLKPEMRNEELIQLKGFGPKLDRVWDTASVIHKIGGSTARTECACWGR